MICVIIDELTPCLKNTSTGEILKTKVFRITQKNMLKNYNSKTGWYVNWGKLLATNEVYALALQETNEIEGLVAIQDVPVSKAVHISWACTAPQNNIWRNGFQKYSGVGGHLFAIAGNRSIQLGYNGFVYGEAVDQELLSYYERQFGAKPFAYGYPPHPYRLTIDGPEMSKIVEVYNYEKIEEM